MPNLGDANQAVLAAYGTILMREQGRFREIVESSLLLLQTLREIPRDPRTRTAVTEWFDQRRAGERIIVAIDSDNSSDAEDAADDFMVAVLGALGNVIFERAVDETLPQFRCSDDMRKVWVSNEDLYEIIGLCAQVHLRPYATDSVWANLILESERNIGPDNPMARAMRKVR